MCGSLRTYQEVIFREEPMLDASHIGCQTYTWEMHGDNWSGTPDDILDAMATTGYAGVEFADAMIGDYFDHPDRFAEAMKQRGLECAAFAYARNGFTDPRSHDEDLAGAEKALNFCHELGVPLCLGGAAWESRDEARFAQAMRFYNAVAERGAALGVLVCAHPHSHAGSLLESAEEYDQFLSQTEDSGLMSNPDAGHIVRGGQDLMDCMRQHRARIRHVHIKDADSAGNWQPLGDGVIDWRAFFDFLRQTAYEGWIVAEEESSLALQDTTAAIRKNREYLQTLGF
jgi:sugar phosphate isomerase/epimerase